MLCMLAISCASQTAAVSWFEKPVNEALAPGYSNIIAKVRSPYGLYLVAGKLSITVSNRFLACGTPTLWYLARTEILLCVFYGHAAHGPWYRGK